MIRHLADWALPAALTAAALRIAAAIAREFRADQRRDQQVHPEDVPNPFDVAAAQAIDWLPGFDEYADTAIALTNQDCREDDFVVWEKELSRA